MMAYRSGQFSEASNLIVDYSPGKGVCANDALRKGDFYAMAVLKENMLSLVFRAMAQYQLGQKDAARQLLQEADRRVPAEYRP